MAGWPCSSDQGFIQFHGSWGHSLTDHSSREEQRALITEGASSSSGVSQSPAAHILPSCLSLQAISPRATGKWNHSAPKEESDISAQEAQVRSTGEEATGPVLTEEGWQRPQAGQ